MITVVRYVNGKKVNKEDLPKYEIDSEIVSKIIKTVNERIKKGNSTKK